MKQVLIYSGTTEGRLLAERLAGNEIRCVVSVATEYGSKIMGEHPNIKVREGRMDAAQMRKLTEQFPFDAVVDATHPYAVEVSQNIRQSMEGLSIPYFRLLRGQEKQISAGTVHYVTNVVECGKYLKEREGAILLTTGSKELSSFLETFEDPKRLYVRVLPAVESILLCQKCQIPGKQILAMQGPFTKELNEALIRQYHIRYLVTKDSGAAGGFPEKEQAAAAAGIELVVIGRPVQEEGLELPELFARLTGKKWKRILHMSLIGAGMGKAEQLTGEAKNALEEAQVIFGAKRLLAEAEGYAVPKLPYYLAEDILPWLAAHPQIKRAAVLFSGDVGFYSGAEKMAQALSCAFTEEVQVETVLYPGISSVSYFAAKLGISWQDAALLSIHGKDSGQEKERVLKEMRTHRYTFLLLSGAKDVLVLAEWCLELDAELTLGYALSYPNERMIKWNPKSSKEAAENLAEGLYLALVENKNYKIQSEIMLPGIADGEFLREQVPMTKQEVRQISIARLKLTNDAVVYDVGSGSGSVSVEIARLSANIRVYAIEYKEQALALTKKNAEKFKLTNVISVKAKAPEQFDTLPAPTHAFIGGSGGRMEEILAALYRKNPALRVVITAVTPETVGEVVSCMKKFPIRDEQITQLNVARAKAAGAYHLMQAENPVFIFSFQFF